MRAVCGWGLITFLSWESELVERVSAAMSLLGSGAFLGVGRVVRVVGSAAVGPVGLLFSESDGAARRRRRGGSRPPNWGCSRRAVCAAGCAAGEIMRRTFVVGGIDE
jgi:hypothetical protein